MTTTIQPPQGMAETTLKLFDVLSVQTRIANAMIQIVEKYNLEEKCANDLKLLKEGASLQQAEVKRLAAKVGVMPLAQETYHLVRNEYPVPWEEGDVPRSYKGREDVYRVQRFTLLLEEWRELSKKRDRQKVATEEEVEAQVEAQVAAAEETVETPPTKKSRQSSSVVTPSIDEVIMTEASNNGRLRKTKVLADITQLIGTGKVQYYVELILANGPIQLAGVTYDTPASVYRLYNQHGFTGEPPAGHDRWSKEQLCEYLSEVEKEEILAISAFANKVIEKRKSNYTERSGLTKMYRKWNENGRKTLGGRGRPKFASVDEVRFGLVEKMNSGTMTSNAIQLDDVKDVMSQIIKNKAEADGLDPNSINAEVSDRTAKKFFLAVSMIGLPEQSVTLSSKTLYDKTATRLIMENSVMGAYSNMLTCATTHILEGQRPKELGGPIDYTTLCPEVAEMFDMMKELLQAEDVFAIHPSCVISTDDSVVYVFEGEKQTGKWKWKLIPKGESNSGADSDFEVNESGKLGGLRVRFTFSFTAAGQMAPVYVTVSGLTEEELDPVLCPSGFLAKKVPNLCKGGTDVHSNGGFGWVVFMRSDKKKKAKHPKDEQWFGMAHQKHVHYNQHVLLPFIRRIRELLGWKPGDPIPDWLRVCCWCDGDIPQLQAMLLEANEALDEQEKIVRNKHPAAGTAVFQPADKCPVFKLLKFVSARTTSANVTATAFKNAITDLINVAWRAEGLNLDGNVGKKKGLIDILSSLPKILEEIGTEENSKEGFYATSMIDRKSGLSPSFNPMMSNCRTWCSAVKGVGVSKEVKDNCKQQFQRLGKIQLEKGQVSYEDMLAAGLPRDVGLDGKEIETAKPSGANNYHLQYALTMNAPWQRRERLKKHRNKAEKKHTEALEEYSIIDQILSSNEAVETELRGTTETGLLEDATIASFMKVKPATKLKDFIHCRKFEGKTFKESKLLGNSKSLNKTLRRNQTAEEIATQCSEEEPCLVWLAWKLRSNELVLKQRDAPTLDLSISQPCIAFGSADSDTVVAKKASDYLGNTNWIGAFESTVKGVTVGTVDDSMKRNADRLVSVKQQRLNFHISERVDKSSYDHITLKFVADNLPAVAAQMCLVGHVMNDVETSECNERLLVLPSGNAFRSFDDEVDMLEGCYLIYHAAKDMWIRDGFACGAGSEACLGGRKKKHYDNSKSISEMRKSRFYRYFASKFAPTTLGKRKGYFEDLVFYCAMAFDPRNVKPICAVDEEDSLFVWRKDFIDFLKDKARKRETTLERMQLSAVAYLWEICYDVMLAYSENISDSPGFEGFGLRTKNRNDRE